MGTISSLLADYRHFYESGLKALKNKQLDNASQCFKEASEVMLKIAELSERCLMQERLDRAMELKEWSDDIRSRMPELKADKKAEKHESRPLSAFTPIHNTGVRFDDVAGLAEAKKQIKSRIIDPINYASIFSKYHKANSGGILFYGVPGTGKTMLAKAVAQEADACFYPIRCSDLVSELFGKTEKNIAALFEEARKYSKSIIFFDEFEAIGCKRGGNSEPMNRIVPELLAQMDGINRSKNKPIIIAATNRPWDIDSAFVRPGRLDVMIKIELPDDEARSYMIHHILNDLPIADDFDYDNAVALTKGFNGADVAEFCEQLKQASIDREIETNCESEICTSDLEIVSKFVRSSVFASDISKIKDFEMSREC